MFIHAQIFKPRKKLDAYYQGNKIWFRQVYMQILEMTWKDLGYMYNFLEHMQKSCKLMHIVFLPWTL